MRLRDEVQRWRLGGDTVTYEESSTPAVSGAPATAEPAARTHIPSVSARARQRTTVRKHLQRLTIRLEQEWKLTRSTY